MKTKEPGSTFRPYEPSRTGLRVLFLLRREATTWASLKRSVQITDTGISKILKSLEDQGAVVRSECEPNCRIKHDHQEGLYQITDIGLDILARTDGLSISSELLRAQQKRRFNQLWEKVRRIHDEVLEKMPTFTFSKQGEMEIFKFPRPKSPDQIILVATAVLDIGHRSRKAFVMKYVDPHKFVTWIEQSTLDSQTAPYEE
jgi:DNA-binding MarR family transcriptional regulator